MVDKGVVKRQEISVGRCLRDCMLCSPSVSLNCQHACCVLLCLFKLTKESTSSIQLNFCATIKMEVDLISLCFNVVSVEGKVNYKKLLYTHESPVCPAGTC